MSRGQKARTPANFPWMKYRAGKRHEETAPVGAWCGRRLVLSPQERDALWRAVMASVGGPWIVPDDPFAEEA